MGDCRVKWRHGEAKITLPPLIEHTMDGKTKRCEGGQIPKSPEHNPDDLGMFKPMNDRIAAEGDNRLYAELRKTVNEVWDGISARMIHNIIRLLPETIKETIRLKGGNHFKIPHRYDTDAEPTLNVGLEEQDWVDKDEHGRDAVWKDPPDGLVGYEPILDVWPAEHCDSDEEPPDLAPDASSSTGVGGAASAAEVEHVRTFAGHDHGDDSDEDRFGDAFLYDSDDSEASDDY